MAPGLGYVAVDVDEDASKHEIADVNKDSIASSAASQIARRIRSDTVQCCVACVILVLITGACVACFFYCLPCLFGVVVLSACLCPWMPLFNLPLWLSILLLVVGGWSFTTGHFSVVWE